MDREQADAKALWCVHTWFIEHLEVSPLLIVTAPERACGKTQALTACSHMVARPMSAANSTASFMFRSLGLWSPTLLIDEVDTFLRHNDEMKGIINAGHTRSSAFVGRTVAVGDTHEPKLFPVWGAKALAGIALEKHLPDSTMSRGIILNLRRKLPHEKVERLRHANRHVFESLRPQLARFALDYGEEVRSAKPHLPDALNDRQQDNWEPLLAIASCAGPEWFDRATQAALKLSIEADSLTNSGNELLADIQEIFETKNKDKITTSELISALVNDEEKSWATYNRGNPLSPRQLANLLKPYGIQPRTVRMLGMTPKGYYRDDFADAFSRYLTREPDPK
jgi:putative DNA primase/helicase